MDRVYSTSSNFKMLQKLSGQVIQKTTMQQDSPNHIKMTLDETGMTLKCFTMMC